MIQLEFPCEYMYLLCHLLHFDSILCIKWLTKSQIRHAPKSNCRKGKYSAYINIYFMPLQITPSANDSEYAKVHIPLALMRYRDFLEAQKVRQSFFFFCCYRILVPYLLFCKGWLDKETETRCKGAHWMLNPCVSPQVFGENMEVKLYAPPQSKLDPSIAVMLLIAIVTVALGGFWSGACER